MKKMFFVLITVFISYQGCKTEGSKNHEHKLQEYVYGTNDGVNEYVYWTKFDDYLDIKSEAIPDTIQFRKEINTLLPPEIIRGLFGSGYHNFYLALFISPESHTNFMLCTDASFWRGQGEETRGLLFNNGKKEPHYSVRSDRDISTKEINSSVFYKKIPDVNNLFKVKAGVKDGKPVESYKLFEINVIIDKSNRIIKPWQIKEVNISKYMEHFFEKDVNRFYYATGLQAVSEDGFESIRKAIAYPKEALENGITGRVIVQIFADAKGDFAGYQLLKGLGYGCDEAVIAAIKNAKFRSYPTGQRSSIIVPFEFGPPQTTPIDLAVQSFEYNPDHKVYNNIHMELINKNKLDRNLNNNYFVYVYIDKHPVFQTICNSIVTTYTQQSFWFRFQPDKPGTYDYAIYIDPENRLNDSNRENNTVRGTVIVK